MSSKTNEFRDDIEDLKTSSETSTSFSETASSLPVKEAEDYEKRLKWEEENSDEMEEWANSIVGCSIQKHIPNEVQPKHHVDIPMEPLQDSFLDRRPTDCEIAKMARRIGSEWQLLGLRLGLHQPCLEHIKMNNQYTADRICKMLMEWRKIIPCEGTFRKLISVLKDADFDVQNILQTL